MGSYTRRQTGVLWLIPSAIVLLAGVVLMINYWYSGYLNYGELIGGALFSIGIVLTPKAILAIALK